MADETMRAMVISRYGGPEVLEERRLPVPAAAPGWVVVRVRAIGLNHAEVYMRRGDWGEVARVTGIECAGEVHADGGGVLEPGRRVVAIVGGMGRTIDGSYAEYVRVPATNVVPIETSLSWEELAAIPEVYATAWACLHQQLRIRDGEAVLVRGGTSALGQAAIDVAREAGATVLATTRSRERFELLRALGAEPVLDPGSLGSGIRRALPGGVDAVLELVGATTLADSLACVRPAGGRVCMAGFLGGLGPLTGFDPLLHLPSGVQLTFYGSAFVLGTRAGPLSEIPLQTIVERVQAGTYRARAVRVFPFEELVEAHRLMESGRTGGKLVARLGRAA
jgi:NADPH:quinone reductase-like Zn-dependent oxidoreductase